MGFAASHIETGRRLTLNSSGRFPMASAYKLPIAIQMLTLVDEGKAQLDRIIKIEPKDIRPGGVPLTDKFNFAESSVSVGDLLEMMLTVSDNIVRIFGAGYWRRGKAIYERQNQIHE